MRTNIDIDGALMAAAMSATGFDTKKATVEEGLRLLVTRKSQMKAFLDMRGLGWEGDLDEMREGWSLDPGE